MRNLGEDNGTVAIEYQGGSTYIWVIIVQIIIINNDINGTNNMTLFYTFKW